MKHTLLVAALLLLSLLTKAQRYTTASVAEYQKIYSGKYSHVQTTPSLEIIWEITPTKIYRDYIASLDNWDVSKVQMVGKTKRYILDAWGLDDIWLTVEGDYVVLYEKGGQTKRTFRIIKKEPLKVLAN